MSDENTEEDCDQAISQPSTSKRTASFNYSQSPGSKKIKELPNSNETHTTSRLENSQHAVTYRLKILIMLVKRCQKYGYSFRIATEKEDAGKFDDAVLLYKRPELANVINYIFLQAKHTQEENASKQAIKENDLLTEKEDKFSLHKYFLSYQKIKRSYEFEEESHRDFIIYTNMGFRFDSDSDHPGLNKLASLYFKNIPNPNELLNIENEGNCYQLDIESEPEIVRRLKEIFENTSDCQKLTSDLVDRILNSKSIGLYGQIKTYHIFLAKYVFDLENKKFNKDFINGVIDGELSDDINSFRDVLLEKIKEHLQEKPPKERTKQDKKILTKLSSKPLKKKRKLLCKKPVDLWSVFEELELKFSEGFGKITILEPIPRILNTTEVAIEIFRLINENKDDPNKVINISRGDTGGNQFIIPELNNLTGHVLVKKIKDGREYAGFSENFLNGEHEELPGNISELRDEVMRAFEVTNKADLKSKLDASTFNISKFNPCQESDVHLLLTTNIPIRKQKVTEADIEDFLKHLFFMVNQPNERELYDSIGVELEPEIKLISSMLPTIQLHYKMLNWFKDEMGTYITGHNMMKDYFDGMKSAIALLSDMNQTSNDTRKLRIWISFCKLKFNIGKTPKPSRRAPKNL